MFESIPTRVIRFEYLDGLELEFRPAVQDLNPLFLVASMAILQPYGLASQLPDDHPRKLSEQKAIELLSRVYGMAVMVGSPTHAEMNKLTPDEWAEWLLLHPDEFESVRSVAEVRTVFVDEAALAAQREASAVAGALVHEVQG